MMLKPGDVITDVYEDAWAKPGTAVCDLIDIRDVKMIMIIASLFIDGYNWCYVLTSGTPKLCWICAEWYSVNDEFNSELDKISTPTGAKITRNKKERIK